MLRRWTIVVVALPLLAACQEPLGPERPAGLVALDPWQRSAATEEILMPWAVASGLSERQRDALNNVREQHVRVLDSNPPNAVLDEIELIFFGDGATFELAGYYREAVERQGADSALRPRLAWLYHWLGMTEPAVTQAEAAVASRPDDAQAWFIRGFVVARTATSTPEQLARARDDFSRTLALDPAFVGPGSISADEVRAEISELEARLPRR